MQGNKNGPFVPTNALDAAGQKRDEHTLSMVQDAIKRQNVMLAYQPVVQTLQPDRVAYFEALIRVVDETGRVIAAKEFIDEIEASETGRMLDCLALEEGLCTLAREPELRLGINMSARSIGNRGWQRILDHWIERDPTVAERLILEITESSAMGASDQVVQFMTKLQSWGISFALDDFGSGFTTFRHFKQFTFDILKIDGQFIRGIANDTDSQVITRAMVSIAQHFDMFTVAEFVEHAEDVMFLTDIGIDCLQGYYFGAPTLSPHWGKDLRHQA
ncbi:hypothetical protein P775_25705 [Puniceibacterium antarcticum]|uniref:EAL domain-containing protein n=1 Tax=Puniceibacterium antarcticum TaxID=1206336 RepID=A0A2G8R200_9RHOB|nr:EAL domain-containing protein [Puniceibacterium antarcticum]PIL15577.1 hypothetical protein P775_25705 [Puniceibacterium antarcticum]